MIDDIRSQVASGILAPGRKLPAEPKLAKQYGISPRSVRSALKELAECGIVRSIPRKGHFIAFGTHGSGSRSDFDSGKARQRSPIVLIDPQRDCVAGTHVVRLNAFNLAEYQRTGLLLNLLPFLKSSGKVSMDAFFPELRNRVVSRGAVHAIPIGFSPLAMVHNRRLLDECGMAQPGRDWTWEDMLRASERISVRDGNGWLQRRWGAPLPWYAHVWQAGGEVIDEARGAYCFDTESALEGMLMYRRLLAAGHCVETNLYDNYEIDRHFLEQRSAFIFAPLCGLRDLQRTATFPIGVSGLPRHHSPVNLVFLTALAIRADSPDPAADWARIEAWCGFEKQVEDYRQFQHYPALKEAALSVAGDDALGMDNRLWIEGLRGARFLHFIDLESDARVNRFLDSRLRNPDCPVPAIEELSRLVADLNRIG